MSLRAVLGIVLVVGSAIPSPAHAYIAREPIVRVIRGANADLVACRERHQMPDGRYLVRLNIDWTGKVTEIELQEAPEGTTPAADSCVAAAFTHLAFASWEVPSPSPETVAGDGRRSRIPPDLSGRTRRTPGLIVILWPFVFAP